MATQKSTKKKTTPPKEKRPVGRPRKFQSVKELQEKIDQYFDSCFIEIPKDGVVQKIQTRPFTITGLALELDTTREVLMHIEEYYDQEFIDTIKKAKQKCQNYAEEFLFRGKVVAGAIFNLKNNYGWKDQILHGSDDDKPLKIRVTVDDGTD